MRHEKIKEEFNSVYMWERFMKTWVHAQSLQSCLTLCDPMDHSTPGSSVCGILQAKILEWAAMPSSRGSSHLGIELVSACISCIAGRFFTH